jgi:hypothetical protein
MASRLRARRSWLSATTICGVAEGSSSVVTPPVRVDWPGAGPAGRLTEVGVGTEGEVDKPRRYSFLAEAEREGKGIRDQDDSTKDPRPAIDGGCGSFMMSPIPDA